LGRTAELPSRTGRNTGLLPLAQSRHYHNTNTGCVAGTDKFDNKDESASDIEGMTHNSGTSFVRDASRRALSYRVAAKRRQKHVADRIQPLRQPYSASSNLSQTRGYLGQGVDLCDGTREAGRQGNVYSTVQDLRCWGSEYKTKYLRASRGDDFARVADFEKA
jgi:hypothetical protein